MNPWPSWTPDVTSADDLKTANMEQWNTSEWLDAAARLDWNGRQLKTAFQLHSNFVPIGPPLGVPLPRLDGKRLIWLRRGASVAGTSISPAKRALRRDHIRRAKARTPPLDWNDFGTSDASSKPAPLRLEQNWNGSYPVQRVSPAPPTSRETILATGERSGLRLRGTGHRQWCAAGRPAPPLLRSRRASYRAIATRRSVAIPRWHRGPPRASCHRRRKLALDHASASGRQAPQRCRLPRHSQ